MRTIWFLSGVFFLSACHPVSRTAAVADSTHFQWTVEEAPQWSSLFIRNQGWLGGDGIFMTTYDGNESPGAGLGKPVTMWFSDTQLGSVAGDSLSPDGAAMIHNSFGLLPAGAPDPRAARFWWDTSGGAAAPVFKPATTHSTPEDYYWLADGFVDSERNKDLFIFGERIASSADNAGFGFKVTGNTLIRVPARNLARMTGATQTDLPFFIGLNQDSTGLFGVGVLVNTPAAGIKNGDGYVYVYGGRKGSLMVARVPPADIDRFDQWRFWDGETWNSDPHRIRTVTDHISNELSMTPLEDGRYLLVFQVDGIAPKVAFRLAASPVGPFGPLVTIYDSKDSIRAASTLYSYNAKVHPVLSRPGELLISYNVNSTNYLSDIKRMPHLYRPRFLKLKYNIDR